MLLDRAPGEDEQRRERYGRRDRPQQLDAPARARQISRRLRQMACAEHRADDEKLRDEAARHGYPEQTDGDGMGHEARTGIDVSNSSRGSDRESIEKSVETGGGE